VLIVPKTVRREVVNGGDVDEYRKQVHNLGALARASSRDKRATFRGELRANERPNRRQRRAAAARSRASR
jgi:hypothetical protein